MSALQPGDLVKGARSGATYKIIAHEYDTTWTVEVVTQCGSSRGVGQRAQVAEHNMIPVKLAHEYHPGDLVMSRNGTVWRMFRETDRGWDAEVVTPSTDGGGRQPGDRLEIQAHLVNPYEKSDEPADL